MSERLYLLIGALLAIVAGNMAALIVGKRRRLTAEDYFCGGCLLVAMGFLWPVFTAVAFGPVLIVPARAARRRWKRQRERERVANATPEELADELLEQEEVRHLRR